MSKLTETVKYQIKQAIMDSLSQAVAEGQLPPNPIPAFVIETPADTTHGDYASNVAMISAKAFRNSPIKIAEIIIKNINLNETYLKSCETAGPGFINFKLKNSFYADVLTEIQSNYENYGRSDYGKGKKVLVEFVSANPTGPMHIGNARGGAIGDCLASILEFAGYTVQREFYVNDAGNQIKKFALSLDLRYRELCGEPIEMPEDSYLGSDITQHSQKFMEIYKDSYISKSEEERKDALLDYALPLNIKGLENDLLKYRIKYDKWFLESTLHDSGDVIKIVELLKEKGHTYEEDGALWFRATTFGCDKDFVLVRSNGIPTYIVPDIAYHYNKLVTRGFDKAINVLGADHHGYVPRIKASIEALGIEPTRLDVVLMQMVRLVRDGEIIKASKRSGKAITLVTLLDEVPIDAARFYFNMREANSQFDFDLDLAVETSSQNPVYYVQYAHARICSIVKNVLAEGIEQKHCTAKQLECLDALEEKELIKYLASFTDTINSCAKTYDSAGITRYSIELATLFHKFYNTCRVRGEEDNLLQSRLVLCICTKQVIKNLLGMLKISAPDIM